MESEMQPIYQVFRTVQMSECSRLSTMIART
jgi:hypothetical protein